MSSPEKLGELFKTYGLTYDKNNPDSKDNDVYVHKHYKIITRNGIQKIESASGIDCKFQIEPDLCNINDKVITIKGYGKLGEKVYETYASVSPDNCKNSYFMEMAEKRCRSRLVLTLAGLYELGVFGEDEAEEFKRKPAETVKPLATYKGA